jgi:hypothetical protein
MGTTSLRECDEIDGREGQSLTTGGGSEGKLPSCPNHPPFSFLLEPCIFLFYFRAILCARYLARADTKIPCPGFNPCGR